MNNLLTGITSLIEERRNLTVELISLIKIEALRNKCTTEFRNVDHTLHIIDKNGYEICTGSFKPSYLCTNC